MSLSRFWAIVTPTTSLGTFPYGTSTMTGLNGLLYKTTQAMSYRVYVRITCEYISVYFLHTDLSLFPATCAR